MKSFRFGFMLVLAVVILASLVAAQTYQGRILGSVTDSSGAVVGGAKVTITEYRNRNFANLDCKRRRGLQRTEP